MGLPISTILEDWQKNQEQFLKKPSHEVKPEWVYNLPPLPLLLVQETELFSTVTG